MYTEVTKLLNELTGMALPKYLDSEQKTFSQFTEKLPCNFFALDSDLRNPIKATFLKGLKPLWGNPYHHHPFISWMDSRIPKLLGCPAST